MACKQFKYKVGDKVRVISDFSKADGHGHYRMENNLPYPCGTGWAVVPSMRELAGEVVTITRLNEYENCYHIDGWGGVRWTDEMFEGLAEKQKKIVITSDGKTTTATLYREDGSKEVATAKCCPEDTFDFNVGAKLAMERLMKKVDPVEKHKYAVGDRIFAEDNVNCHPGGAWGTVVEVLDKRYHNEDYMVKFDDHQCLCSHVVPVPTTPEPPKYFTGKVICIKNSINDGEFTVGKIYEIKDGNFTDNLGHIRPNTGGCDRVRKLSDLENEYYRDWYYKFIPIVE